MRKLFLLILILLGLTFIGAIVFAQPGSKIDIVGTGLLQLDIEKGIYYGEGDIQLLFDNIILGGDSLIWDINKQELRLEGNAFMDLEDQMIQGESLNYNIDTQKGEFLEAKSQLTAGNIKGPIFVLGDSIKLEGNNYHLQTGKISTCALEEPHYHLAVKDIQIYPGDRLIIRGVTFHEFGLPLFYWPYLVIPLDGRYDNLDFTLPEVGYNEEEGYYIKNRYNYYFSKNASGSILYDYFTRKGPGLGIDHTYSHSLLGKGRVMLYGLPLAPKSPVTAYVEHMYDYQGERLKLNSDNRYLWKREDSTTSQEATGHLSMAYNYNNIRATSSFYYNGKISDVPEKLNWSATAGWNQKITSQLSLNASSSTKTNKGRRTIDHLIETNYNLGNHTLNLGLQQRYNPEILEEDKSTTWTSVNRLPELTWKWQNPGFGKQVLKGKFQLSIGNIIEKPANIRSIRVVPELELYTQSWNSSFGTTISYSGGARGYFYRDDIKQQQIFGRINLSQKITDTTNLSLTYNKQSVWGHTPFQFDLQSPTDRLTGDITYSRRPLTLSLQMGYDFLNQKYDNLVPRVIFNNEQGLSANLSVNYNPNNKTFSTLIGRLDYRAYENLIFGLGGTYNIDSGELLRYDGKISYDLTEKIKLNYEVIFDISKSSKFTKGELVLIFDLHCRSLKFTYNHIKPEVKLQYSINAFPQLPVGYSSTSGISLFKLKDLQDTIGLELF